MFQDFFLPDVNIYIRIIKFCERPEAKVELKFKIQRAFKTGTQ